MVPCYCVSNLIHCCTYYWLLLLCLVLRLRNHSPIQHYYVIGLVAFLNWPMLFLRAIDPSYECLNAHKFTISHIYKIHKNFDFFVDWSCMVRCRNTISNGDFVCVRVCGFLVKVGHLGISTGEKRYRKKIQNNQFHLYRVVIRIIWIFFK